MSDHSRTDDRTRLLTNEENERVVLEVVLHLSSRSSPLVVDESLGRRNDGETSLREVSSKVGSGSVVSVNVCILVSGDSDGVTEVTRRTRLEYVVADRSTESTSGSAVVGSPNHSTDRDTDFHHVCISDQSVAFDNGTFERSGPGVPVNHVDTSERTTVPSDNGVARDG